MGKDGGRGKGRSCQNCEEDDQPKGQADNGGGIVAGVQGGGGGGGCAGVSALSEGG